MWGFLFVFVLSVAVSFALRPKAPDVQPAATEDLQFPTAEAGSPITVVFGTVLVSSPNIVWYGDLGYVAIKSGGGK